MRHTNHIVPEQLAVKSLHLSPRATNALVREGIHSAAQLLALPIAKFAQLEGIGKASVDEVQDVDRALRSSETDSGNIDLVKYLSDRGVRILDLDLAGPPNEITVVSSFPEIVTKVLSNVEDERMKVIIPRRFGLAGSPTLTLEELGLAYRVTRERIRQLESSALSILRDVLVDETYTGRPFHVHPRILECIRSIRRDIEETFPGATHEDLVIQLLQERHGRFESAWKPTLTLLLTIFGYHRITLRYSDLLPIWAKWGPSEQAPITSAIEAAHKILTRETAHPMSAVDILIKVNKGLSATSRLDLQALEEVLVLCSSIKEHSEGYFEARFQFLATRMDQVERILIDQSEPMHHDEIARELSHRLSSMGEGPINARTLVNQMSGDDRFVPIGKSGEWALSDWSLETSSIVDLMERCLVARNKPQPSQSVFQYVLERRPVQRSSIDTYLQTDSRFARIGDDLWGIAEWKESKASDYWSPRRVGDFVASIFAQNRRRKLPYSEIKEALVRESGLRPRQVIGMLVVNPVVTTEHDDATSELMAIYHADYQKKIAEGRARIPRATPTLRDRAGDRVRQILERSSTGRISLSTLVHILEKDLGGSERTFYSYISDMDFVEKVEVPESQEKIVQFRTTSIEELHSVIEDIKDDDLRSNVFRALSFLNEADVDVCLFLLAKEFEAALKRYLMDAANKGIVDKVPVPQLSLDRMISIVAKEAIITDQAILHFLRQKRNDRAHGATPSLRERRLMLKHADTTVALYVDYIHLFDDLWAEIAV